MVKEASTTEEPKEEVTPAMPQLIKQLTGASRLIGAVAKDGTNTMQHYEFQSEGAIKDAVKTAINSVGIQIIPSFEVLNQYDRDTRKGTVLHFVDVMGHFRITNGYAEIEGTMAGSGQDTGEKAMMKAETAAQKYFFKQLFNISDREPDPDTTDSAPDGGYQPQTQVEYDNRRQMQQQQQQQQPQVAAEQDVANFLQLVSDFAKQENAESNTVYRILVQNSGVPAKKVSTYTPEELGKLKNALNQLIKAQPHK